MLAIFGVGATSTSPGKRLRPGAQRLNKTSVVGDPISTHSGYGLTIREATSGGP